MKTLRRLAARYGAVVPVAAAAAPRLALAQGTGNDPLSALVAGVNFSNLETDLVSVGVALAALYIIWVGIHWILRMIRHG